MDVAAVAAAATAAAAADGGGVRVERIARVELKADHVMLWTWEKIGPGTPTASYNMIFERLIHCNNAATLEAMFLRLWHVAEQRDRATIYAHRRTQA